jgi:hypothetical protein
MRPRSLVWVPSIVIALVTLSACGSGAGSSGSSATSTTVDLSVLSATNPATGVAIKVGLVVDGKSDARDSTSVLASGKRHLSSGA